MTGLEKLYLVSECDQLIVLMYYALSRFKALPETSSDSE